MAGDARRAGRDQGLAVVLTLLAGSAGVVALAGAAERAPPGISPAASYQVVVAAQASELRVEATFLAGLSDDFTLDQAALPFVDELTFADGDTWRPAPRRGRGWSASGCRAHGCRLRYQFRLAEAARAIDDLDTVAARADVTIAPTTTWLLRPTEAPEETRFQLSVKSPAPWVFVSGLPRSAAGYEGPLAREPLAPYAGFGVLAAHRLEVAGGVVEVATAKDVASAAVLPWLRDAAQAMVAFYGRFPVPRLQVIVLPPGARMQGKELGGGGASILLAPDQDPAHSGNDWVAAHEMVHVATPDLSRRYLWMTEGLATYVEPIARARAGQLDAGAVWADLVRGMPKGLAHETDRGMNGTRDWGRLYWGGAVFWLLADIQIRTATKNRQSLETALRAVVAAGGTTFVSWPVERFLDEGDRPLPRPVLRPLYQKMGMQPMPVDLPALWRQLGVSPKPGGGVAFDDRAPLAHVRAAITAAAPR